MSASVPCVAVDAMGGDNAPGEIVAGALDAHREGVARIILVGDRAKIAPLAGDVAGVDVRHCDGVIAMDAHAAAAARSAAGTSLGTAVELVRDGTAQACISAGNSGAFLAVAVLRLRPIAGIARPAIGATLPGRFGAVVLCDAGANVDCKPEWLLQFGIMGSVYARATLGVSAPRVGVLSVGEEPTKGNALSLAAYRLLQTAPVNFIGNVEGRDVWANHVDVVVCDGFVGNVMLKTAEGAGAFFRDTLQDALRTTVLNKAGAALARGAFATVRERLSYESYGGAPLLGVRGCCVVAHGRSNRVAIKNAIAVAARSASADIVGTIARDVAETAGAAS